jgi:hypothetical protein
MWVLQAHEDVPVLGWADFWTPSAQADLDGTPCGMAGCGYKIESMDCGWRGRWRKCDRETGLCRGSIYLLYSDGIRIFDYPHFAAPLRDRIREHAQQVCQANGVPIEHVNNSHIRKEDLATKGGPPALPGRQ